MKCLVADVLEIPYEDLNYQLWQNKVKFRTLLLRAGLALVYNVDLNGVICDYSHNTTTLHRRPRTYGCCRRR